MEIKLNKSPESPEERKKMIGEIIKEQEMLLAQSIGYIQRMIIQYLLELGYNLNDVEINKQYEIIVSENEKFLTSVDMVVSLEEKVIYAIKCSPASIDSWERFMFAFCRVVEPYQIPFAVVTDGQRGITINILTGQVSEKIQILSKEELMKMMPSLEFIPYNQGKLAKEKRILYAFDAIKCCPTCNL